jgi:glycolate oxidase iron-sulfur subunit
MKSVLEGEITPQDAAPHIDRCLGCLACVTACPSGVKYEELLAPYRAYVYKRVKRPPMKRVQRILVEQTLPYPGRFRTATSLSRLTIPVKGLLPGELRAMLALVPERNAPAKALPALTPAVGKRRARVALLAGCVQQSLAAEINWATLLVLANNGVEVVIPHGQGCCGSILMHTGDQDGARRLAKTNLQVFPQDVDAVLTNAAGCGSGMKEYGMLFAGQPEAEAAEAFAGRVKDVTEFLGEFGIDGLHPLDQPLKIAYHDACHLAHAQKVREAPRQLLKQVPNLTLVEIQEGDMCCGSAGTYNIEQPEIAEVLGKRKADNILHSDSQAVVTGNIGCMVQIRSALEKNSTPLPVYHIMEVLAMGYR